MPCKTYGCKGYKGKVGEKKETNTQKQKIHVKYHSIISFYNQDITYLWVYANHNNNTNNSKSIKKDILKLHELK